MQRAWRCSLENQGNIWEGLHNWEFWDKSAFVVKIQGLLPPHPTYPCKHEFWLMMMMMLGRRWVGIWFKWKLHWKLYKLTQLRALSMGIVNVTSSTLKSRILYDTQTESLFLFGKNIDINSYILLLVIPSPANISNTPKSTKFRFQVYFQVFTPVGRTQ